MAESGRGFCLEFMRKSKLKKKLIKKPQIIEYVGSQFLFVNAVHHPNTMDRKKYRGQ